MHPDRALEYVASARRIGAARDLAVTAAVVDAAGHPVAVVRGSGDRWHGPYMAIGKARLAAAFRRTTADLLSAWADRPLFAASLLRVLPEGVTLNPGGCPIFENGECIGAIGVGGGSPKEDDEVARSAVAEAGGSLSSDGA
jgi:glc operon protein GlcG